jgi:hypothetical protein
MSFSDCIVQTTNAVLNLKKTTINKISPTFFDDGYFMATTPEEDEVSKNKVNAAKIEIKKALTTILDPIFIYMRAKVAEVNATITLNETKIVGENDERFGMYASPAYLKHRMGYDTFKYQRTFELQTLLACAEKEIDAARSNHLLDTITKILSDLAESITLAEKEIAMHTMIDFGYGKYAAAVRAAMILCDKEKKQWEAKLTCDETPEVVESAILLGL